jgi:hypothetical protein
VSGEALAMAVTNIKGIMEKRSMSVSNSCMSWFTASRNEKFTDWPVI